LDGFEILTVSARDPRREGEARPSYGSFTSCEYLHLEVDQAPIGVGGRHLQDDRGDPILFDPEAQVRLACEPVQLTLAAPAV